VRFVPCMLVDSASDCTYLLARAVVDNSDGKHCRSRYMHICGQKLLIALTWFGRPIDMLPQFAGTEANILTRQHSESCIHCLRSK